MKEASVSLSSLTAAASRTIPYPLRANPLDGLGCSARGNTGVFRCTQTNIMFGSLFYHMLADGVSAGHEYLLAPK